MDQLPYLLIAYTTYVIGTASPGPANFAIMSTAMDSGRRPALAFAAGVISGSQTWGAICAFGVGALLHAHATAMSVLQVFGGVYLFWLAYRALRLAMTPAPTRAAIEAAAKASPPQSLGRHFLRGYSLHLTNPKAMLVWLTVISLGMPQGSPGYFAALVVVGCGFLGILVFSTYAVVFSTKAMIHVYNSYRPHINAVLVVVFALAGGKLIFDQL
jgi:threonine efflux protein